MSRGKHQGNLDRRQVLAGAAVLSAAPLMGGIVPADAKAQRLGQTMIDKVGTLMKLLNEKQTDAARFAFDHPERKSWNYMYGSRVAPGLPMENMTQPQKDAALDLVASSLSPDGFKTLSNIMLQQDILRDEWGKGSPGRNRERFSFSLFGNPTQNAPWSWRWEGHHLTITFTLVGDKIVSHTPKAFSSEPNTVPSGPHKGLVVLPENEVLGRAVYGDLKGVLKKQALIEERSIGNIITTAGRENWLGRLEGVPLGDLSQPQIDKLLRLLDVYTVNHLTPAEAMAQKARLKKQDLMAAHFAWSGGEGKDESIYYRLHGETFLIEFATLRNQPQHHHTIVHDLERNLGAHAI